MKEFPRFSEANIQPSISQLHMKLLLAVLSHFRDSLDGNPSTDTIKSAIDNAKQGYQFKFADDYANNPDSFKLHLEQLLDLLGDAYVVERFKYQDAINVFIHDFYQENMDSETFDIADGETLRVSQNG